MLIMLDLCLSHKSLRKYEESYESARRSKEQFEKAHEDLDLSRAQLEKAREVMNSKGKLSTDAQTHYQSQMSVYNESQRLFYGQQLPRILIDLQTYASQHSDQLKHVYQQSIQAHVDVLPRIQICLNEIVKQVDSIDSTCDANMVIDEYKSGYTIPDDHKPVDLLVHFIHRMGNVNLRLL
jgi:formin-binding protein 1